MDKHRYQDSAKITRVNLAGPPKKSKRPQNAKQHRGKCRDFPGSPPTSTPKGLDPCDPSYYTERAVTFWGLVQVVIIPARGIKAALTPTDLLSSKVNRIMGTSMPPILN